MGMDVLKRMCFVVGCAAVAICTAAKPQAHIELGAASTNLVVTEETHITVRLWLPPLEGELAEIPPFLNQRPPHVSASFLEQEWKSTVIVPADPRNLPPVVSRSRDRNVPVYTLNSYVSDDFFGGMRDPFSMFGDDDFFGRTLGPKAQRFPFVTRRVERDGVNGWEFSIETLPYRAVTPGRVEISPIVVKVPVIASVKTKRDRFGRAVKVPSLKEVKLQTSNLVIDVAEPPANGRPRSYCGAIASNLTVTATLDATVCTAGDPLVLTLDIAGASDAAAVHPPSFASVFDKDSVFRLDAASLKTETLAASRRFTWRVRTVKAGTVEFPALPVSYYDIDKRDYVTVNTEMIPVQVKAGAQATLGTLGDVEDEDDGIYPFPDGIDIDIRGAATERMLPHLVVSLALFIGAPFVFLLVRIVPPIRRRIAVRSELNRKANAFKKCRSALKGRDGAKRAAAIRRFFADRYDVNGATVTAVDARRLMANDFTDEEIELVTSTLSDADCAAYSGGKKTMLSLLLICLLPFAMNAASTDFTYRRACSLAAHASDECGFKKTAAAFSDCIKNGAANPIIFSNLGACLVMSGNWRDAQAVYRRAERWGGETASTRRGLRAARARLMNDPRADLPITRIFFGAHYKFSLDARLFFAAICWTVCWLMALLPGGSLRRFMIVVVGIACLAAVVSVSISVAEELMTEGIAYVAQ